MLCEIANFGNFLTTWFSLFILGLISVFVLSTPLFLYYYVYPTYEKWSNKSNPVYPPATKVRDEILQTLKCAFVGVLPPSISLWMNQHNYSQGYCGDGGFGWTYHILCFFVVWQGSDFYEFYYHRLGHITNIGWLQHKHHHVFYNPTPFSVIADEYVDQFIRALPLVVIPIIVPMNMDQMYFTYGVFFYGYGVLIHSGQEFKYLNAHSWWINTPYQHYIHHAKGRYGKPYHTGFFIKLWDRMFGSLYDGECTCTICQKAAGKKSLTEWEKVKFQDYSVLLNWKFQVWGDKFDKNFDTVEKTVS